MAKIPDIASLGQRPTPEPSLGVVGVRGATGAETALGETLAGFGKQLGVTAKEWQQTLDVEKAKFDRVRAEDAFNQLENRRLELQTGDDGFMKRKGSAAIDPATTKDYGQRFSLAQKSILDGLQNEEQKRLFQSRAGVSQRAFQQSLQAHVFQEDNVYRKGVYEGGVDTSYRAAISSWNNAPDVQAQLVRMGALIDERGKDQGWSPEIVAAEKAKVAAQVHAGVIGQALAAEQTGYAKQWYDQFKGDVDPQTAQRLFKEIESETQKSLFNGYNRVLSDNRVDRRTLSTLEKTVADDSKLDEGRKNVLLNSIRSKVDMLDRRAEMAQMKWERQIERQISAVNNITLQGFEVNADQMAPLVAATKGTSYEPQVKQMIATSEATRQFRLSDPRQQESMLTQIEQAARKDPTKFDLTMLSRFRSIYEGQQKAVRDDPVSFAARQGLVGPDDAVTKPLDMSKPELLGPQLAARAALGRGMQSRYGAPLKVLTKEETDTLTTALRSAPAADKAKYLGALSRGLQDDPKAYSALLAQIAPDDPVTAIAGARAAGNSRDPKGRLVSDLMLLGQEILNPPKKSDGSPAGGKLWPMPKMTDMELQFTQLEKDAMKGLPRMRSDMQQAVYAVYAAKTAEAGDTTQVVDSKRMRESFEAVAGKTQRWNGSYTVIPSWSTPGRFRDGIRDSLNALVATGQLDKQTADRAWELPLELAGEGRYRIRGGDSYLTNKQGHDVVLDLSASAMIPSFRAVGSVALNETPGGAVTGMEVKR